MTHFLVERIKVLQGVPVFPAPTAKHEKQDPPSFIR